MKDSRIGTYGTLALGMTVALRVAAVAALPPWIGAAALVAAHAGGRLAAAVTMTRLPYAGDPAATHLTYIDADQQGPEIALAAMFMIAALLPLARYGVFATLVGVLFGAVLAVWLVDCAVKLIDGYTGDVLGATEQLFEVGFLLGAAAMLRA